ncbi:hypothetical protein [Ruminococcus albus]|uniref:Uncharacterized protein n=1 Tax=Ruminococcus albus TaxID=1264 RepID=A0A1H7FX86_RUMAL|nr:hypothetical protein [Ruminococcus albus]SEK28015.1 hypothetical protein SAMN05216469_101358 [Ruminococcus albus]
MNKENVTELINTVNIYDLHEYKYKDRILLFNGKLYQLSSKEQFEDNKDSRDNFLVVKITDENWLYYKYTPKDDSILAIQLEQYKTNELLKSINSKLTFFVILTIIGIITSIIMNLNK